MDHLFYTLISQGKVAFCILLVTCDQVPGFGARRIKGYVDILKPF